MEEIKEREGFAEEVLKAIDKPTPLIDISKRTGVSYSKLTKMAERLGLTITKKQIMIPRYVLVVEKREGDNNAG